MRIGFYQKSGVISLKMIELELKTINITEMQRFYADTLGLVLVDQSEDGFTVQAGATRLTFIREQDETVPYYHFAMNIPENQIAEAKNWLLNRGCSVLQAEPIDFLNIHAEADIAYFHGTDAHAVYFEDPAGNLVEFIARHRLGNPSNGTFGSSSILNISEIGFPLRGHMPETIDFLSARIPLAPYIGDGRSFQMLGDDHGMFILGDHEIGWYPTKRMPEIHPIRMTVLAEQPNEFQLDGYPYLIRTVPGAAIECQEAIRP